jgi:hypothetical protein
MSTGKNTPIVIDTINILVSTNIPDQKDISLTSKVLVGTSPNAAKYNEYPYITNSVQLKGSFMRNKSYNEILDFFFIKEVFAKYANAIGSSAPEDEPEEPEKKQKGIRNVNYEKEREEWKIARADFLIIKDKRDIGNLDYNIKKMLQLLFATYPIAGNIKNTTETGYITDVYNTTKYSYLSINSKNYTISKAIWINDKYNHYITKQLVKDYKEFEAWRTGEVRNVDTAISDNKKQSKGLLKVIENSESTQNIFESDILKIEKYFMNVSNWTNKNQSLSTITIREAMGILYSHLIILETGWYKDSIKKKKDRLDAELSKYVIPKVPATLGTPATSSTPKIPGEPEKPESYKCDKNDYVDIKERVETIKKILNSNDTYNLKDSREFMSELNRTSKIIIGSNLVSVSNIVQNTIKDLNENNEKRITLESNRNYIKDETIILGNEKYKNDNFKILSDAFVKGVQLVKKNINYMTEKKGFDFDKIKGLIDEIQNPEKISENDAFGIIYDNNNVSKPKYEIYMYMDLTDGKITDENRDNLDLCTFRDELLLIKFTQLMNKNTNLIQHDPLIKMLSNEKPKQNTSVAVQAKVADNIKPKATENIKPKATENIKPTQGGSSTKKVYYGLKNNRTKKINN